MSVSFLSCSCCQFHTVRSLVSSSSSTPPSPGATVTSTPSCGSLRRKRNTFFIGLWIEIDKIFASLCKFYSSTHRGSELLNTNFLNLVKPPKLDHTIIQHTPPPPPEQFFFAAVSLLNWTTFTLLY